MNPTVNSEALRSRGLAVAAQRLLNANGIMVLGPRYPGWAGPLNAGEWCAGPVWYEVTVLSMMEEKMATILLVLTVPLKYTHQNPAQLLNFYLTAYFI